MGPGTVGRGEAAERKETEVGRTMSLFCSTYVVTGEAVVVLRRIARKDVVRFVHSILLVLLNTSQMLKRRRCVLRADLVFEGASVEIEIRFRCRERAT